MISTYYKEPYSHGPSARQLVNPMTIFTEQSHDLPQHAQNLRPDGCHDGPAMLFHKLLLEWQRIMAICAV